MGGGVTRKPKKNNSFFKGTSDTLIYIETEHSVSCMDPRAYSFYF